jgi:TM2 domain-containing membrane protein YozV
MGSERTSMVEWILKPQKQVSTPMAVVILILNILPLPGLGTVIYGRVLRGILEFITAFLLVGWIFAILDGIQILTRTTTGKAIIPTTTGRTA